MPQPDRDRRATAPAPTGRRGREGRAVGRSVSDAMEAALAPGVIRPVLQPVFELSTGRIAGYEALARFDNGPSLGPAELFAGAAAAGDRGRRLELAAVRAHLTRFGELQDPAYLALNVSPATAVCDELAEVLRPVPARRLVLEISAGAAVPDPDALRAGLAAIRAGGVRLAVDDAGTGPASLRQLLDLEPDIVKLDLTVTHGLDTDPARRALAAAFCAFAGQLGMAVVAEGIETAGEFTALLDLGVGYGQGYFLAHPSDELQRALYAAAAAPTDVVSGRLAPTVKVAVVEDHAIVGQAVAALLSKNPRLEITGVALSPADAVALIETQPPDVVVCAIHLGDESGFTLLNRFAGRKRPCFVMYSSDDHPIYHRAAFEGGAAGFVLKAAQPDELTAAIFDAARGKRTFSPKTLQAVHSPDRVPTARELSVLEGIAGGRSTVEIAAALGISPRTVESHLRTLFDRAGVLSRTELVLHAVREGWIRPTTTRPVDRPAAERRAGAWLVDAGLMGPRRGRAAPGRPPTRRD